MSNWETDNSTSFQAVTKLALWDDLTALWDSINYLWDAVDPNYQTNNSTQFETDNGSSWQTSNNTIYQN